MIKIEITGEGADELRVQIALLSTLFGIAPAATNGAAATTTGKRGGKKQAAVVEETASSLLDEGDGEEEKTFTIDDIKKALTEFVGTHGEAKAVALVKKHGGVAKISALDPSKYGAVMAAIEATD